MPLGQVTAVGVAVSGGRAVSVGLAVGVSVDAGPGSRLDVDVGIGVVVGSKSGPRLHAGRASARLRNSHVIFIVFT